MSLAFSVVVAAIVLVVAGVGTREVRLRRAQLEANRRMQSRWSDRWPGSGW